MSQGHEITVKLTVKEKGQDFGFTFLGGKDEGQVLIASLLEGNIHNCFIQYLKFIYYYHYFFN